MNQSTLLELADAMLRIDLDELRWLESLSGALEEARPHAVGAVGYTYRYEGQTVRLQAELRGANLPDDINLAGISSLDDGQRERVYGEAGTATTALEVFGGRLPDPLARRWHPAGVHDVLGLITALPDGSGVAIATAEHKPVDKASAEQLRAVVGRLKLAMMLRRALGGQTLEEAAMAIFSDAGRCLHWSSHAEAYGSADDAVDRIQVRRALRESFERTGSLHHLDLWNAICTGKMLLIDSLDSEGRKRIVMLPVPEPGGPGLTATERRIAEFAGQALSNKEIAQRIRISESAVENHLSRALRKMRITTRIDLVRIYTRCERLPSSG